MYQEHKLGKCYPGTNYRTLLSKEGDIIGLARRVNAAVFGKNIVWAIYKPEYNSDRPKFFKTMEDYRMNQEYVF